jgi:hypothetical protein
MEDTSMNPLPARLVWALGLLALVLIITAAAVSYNAGVSHGLAQVAMAPGNTTPPPYPYGWHRSWGFSPVFPLLFIFFCVFMVRGLWWGWGPRHYWHGGYGSYDRERFDEWHRRAHDQMKG